MGNMYIGRRLHDPTQYIGINALARGDKTQRKLMRRLSKRGLFEHDMVVNGEGLGLDPETRNWLLEGGAEHVKTNRR